MQTERGPFYHDRRVLVTGGAGFIGSNLVRRLLELGSQVTVVDSLLPECGGNLFNLDDVRRGIALHLTDLRETSSLTEIIEGQEVIFNLAGQVSHQDSMTDPLSDLDINCRCQAALLEVCRRYNPNVRIIYSSTRQVYGRPHYVPVDEAHPAHPIDVNGINKLAGEQYHLLYHQVYGMWVSVLRLTNTYGPRQLIRHARQGFIAWFVRQALEGGIIQLYGDGKQQRDLTYVDDVVEALLMAGTNDAANGEVFNLGGSVASLIDLARMLCELCPGARYDTVPFPADRQRIDIGSYIANWDKLRRTLGWSPTVDLPDGLERMIDYYRRFDEHYK